MDFEEQRYKDKEQVENSVPSLVMYGFHTLEEFFP